MHCTTLPQHCSRPESGKPAAFSEDRIEGALQKFNFFYRGVRAAAENKHLKQMLRSSSGLVAALSLCLQ